MAVRVAAWQNILATAQRIEVSGVEQIPLRHIQVLLLTCHLIGIEAVLSQRVRLVVRACRVGIQIAVEGSRRHVADCAAGRVVEGLKGRGDAGELVRVEQADHVLVVVVSGKVSRRLLTRVAVAIGCDRGCESVYQSLRLGSSGRIPGRCGEPRQRRDVLAKAVAGRETIAVVPPSHVFSGCGQSGAYAQFLQQWVFVQGQVRGVNAVELCFEGSACEFDVRVAQQKELFTRARCWCRGSDKPSSAQRYGAREALQELSPGQGKLTRHGDLTSTESVGTPARLKSCRTRPRNHLTARSL